MVGLSPAHFGMVMATGIVSARWRAHVGYALAGEDAVPAQRSSSRGPVAPDRSCMFRYPRRFFGDMVESPARPRLLTHRRQHQRARQPVRRCWLRTTRAATVLWIVALCALDCASPHDLRGLTIRSAKPSLDSGHQRRPAAGRCGNPVDRRCSAGFSAAQYRAALPAGARIFALLDVAVGGIALHLDDVAGSFYRYTFFLLLSPATSPPYWINMGAMATLHPGGLVSCHQRAPTRPSCSLLPFIMGFTVLYWATGTWWIPMLVVLALCAIVYRRFLRYDPPTGAPSFPSGCVRSARTSRSRRWDFLPALPAGGLPLCRAGCPAGGLPGLAHDSAAPGKRPFVTCCTPGQVRQRRL